VIVPVFNLIFPFFINFARGGILNFFGLIPGGIFGDIIFGFVFAFIWDFWQYSVHRLQHSSKYLWETHRFHHSEDLLNSSAQARTHIMQSVLYLVLYFPLLLIFGGQSPNFIIAFFMFRFLGVYNHSNIRLNLGFLTPVISGPHWHRIHHSIEPEHQNKNFAAIFPVIDIIGGTYYRPAREEYPETGLTDREKIGYFRDATFLPFLRWWGIVRKKS
jgi:sterol desaturase/sphingolipid hydroxylase (fatty acid hydroxylase superfamily)